MTAAERATLLQDMAAYNTSNLATKSAIRSAIVARGLNIPVDPFSSYALRLFHAMVVETETLPTSIKSTPFVNGNEPTTGTIWYVREGGAGSQNGTSWANAFPERCMAVAAASAGDSVYVMEGVYIVSQVQLPKYGVSEYYGFSSSGLWADRQPFTHPSVIDALYTNSGWRNDNIVFQSGQVVDGIWVRNTRNGPGVYCGAVGNIKHVTAYGCKALINAGGIILDGGGLAERCQVLRCSTVEHTSKAVGLYCKNATIRDCTIKGCTTSIYGTSSAVSVETGGVMQGGYIAGIIGGGLYIGGGSVDGIAVVGCKGNSYGGGVQLRSGTISNSRAIGCSSSYGGGFYISTGVAYNCTALHCVSSTEGGGIFVEQGGSLVNCTALNCYNAYASRTSAGITAYNPCTIYNSVSYGSPFGANVDHAFKFYNCASDLQMDFTATPTQADVQNFVTLTSNPFVSLGVSPFNVVNAPFAWFGTSDTELATIDTNLLPYIGDPHPTTGSTLLGAGRYIEGVTPALDADGVTRPSPPSIGAYELPPA